MKYKEQRDLLRKAKSRRKRHRAQAISKEYHAIMNGQAAGASESAATAAKAVKREKGGALSPVNVNPAPQTTCVAADSVINPTSTKQEPDSKHAVASTTNMGPTQADIKLEPGADGSAAATLLIAQNLAAAASTMLSSEDETQDAKQQPSCGSSSSSPANGSDTTSRALSAAAIVGLSLCAAVNSPAIASISPSAAATVGVGQFASPLLVQFSGVQHAAAKRSAEELPIGPIHKVPKTLPEPEQATASVAAVGHCPSAAA